MLVWDEARGRAQHHAQSRCGLLGSQRCLQEWQRNQDGSTYGLPTGPQHSVHSTRPSTAWPAEAAHGPSSPTRVRHNEPQAAWQHDRMEPAGGRSHSGQHSVTFGGHGARSGSPTLQQGALQYGPAGGNDQQGRVYQDVRSAAAAQQWPSMHAQGGGHAQHPQHAPQWPLQAGHGGGELPEGRAHAHSSPGSLPAHLPQGARLSLRVLHGCVSVALCVCCLDLNLRASKCDAFQPAVLVHLVLYVCVQAYSLRRCGICGIPSSLRLDVWCSSVDPRLGMWARR